MSDVDDLVSRWRPYTYRWVCPVCGRRLGCPAALDAHELDHGPDGVTPGVTPFTGRDECGSVAV